MTMFDEYLSLALRQPVIGERLAESCSVLDISGYNYIQPRYEIDHELFPNRVIVGSETDPPKIDELWRLVQVNDHVIGDFTWTGWDYLGEAGIGRVEYQRNASGYSSLLAAYPWLTASTGDHGRSSLPRRVRYQVRTGGGGGRRLPGRSRNWTHRSPHPCRPGDT
jgi:beta-galactosidase